MEVKRKSSLRRKCKGLCGFLLALCMVVTAMPALSMDAYAAPGDPAIKLGTAGIPSGDKVYFGKYTDGGTTYDVPWIVLENNKLSETTTAANTLPLLSEYLLGGSAFRSSSIGSGYYSGSTLQGTMVTIYNGFDSKEKDVVADTTLKGDSMYSGEANLFNQKLFPLSFEEAANLGWKSEILKAKSISATSGGAGWWWLRSSDSDGDAFCVDDVGNNILDLVNLALGVRPAFYLNLSSVLFSSAATGGKSSTVSTLAPVGTNSVNEWKLTLKDTERNSFNVSDVARTDTTLYIKYENAKTGSGEYISAVVDKASNITHYAKLKALSDAGSTSGYVTITGSIPATTLYVFNEQDNGDKKTDYASDLKQVTIPTNVDAYDLSVNLTGLTSDGTPYAKMSADYSATLIPDTGYTFPANITVKVNGTELTAGTDTYSYDQATGKLEIKKGKITGKIEIIAAGVLAPTGGGGSTQVSQEKIDRPDPFVIFLNKTIQQIADAKEGATITIDFGDFNVLTLPVMKQMALRRDLTIQMKYRYKGQKYEVTFPAGMPIKYQDEIRYYGPLKLADMAIRAKGSCVVTK